MGTEVAELLAERLRAGYANALDEGLAAPADFVGEEVEIVHEPARADDGPRPGALMAKRWRREGSTLRAAMPDFAVTDVVVRADGDDRVVLRGMTSGTPPDRDVLVSDFEITYGLENGRIVRAEVRVTPR
jgi:hypothetical protein